MTEQELRALDGPELTAQAFRLGMAPQGAWRCGPEICLSLWQRWRPHDDLAQAEACVRGLRAWGYCTSNTWEETSGLVQVFRDNRLRHEVPCWQEEYTTEEEEAHALLLCAVIAINAEVRP